MRRLLPMISVLSLLAGPALAQQPPKTTLEFDAQQLQMLGEALTSLPKRVADPFIADLNRQIQVQQQAAAEKAKALAAPAAEPPPPSKP